MTISYISYGKLKDLVLSFVISFSSVLAHIRILLYALIHIYVYIYICIFFTQICAAYFSNIDLNNLNDAASFVFFSTLLSADNIST